LTALKQAASCFVGEHDFLSFAATDPDLATRDTHIETHSQSCDADPAQSTVRKVYSSLWGELSNEAGDLLVYRIRGNGFLHHMVRNLAGTMIDVGRGLLGPGDIPRILAARTRSAAGPTAPARGLFLHSVEYE
jgi:tRNA pseudouridine38-40 synthase